jgi:aspartyl-tRNA(Asn)/glutamyl-tRNA(Gln) amidotransferase subunit A
MHQLTLSKIVEALNQKEFSSKEIVSHYLDRIQKYDTQLNSFITLTPEVALKKAAEADALRQKKHDYPPLLGVPIAQKDIFCTEGIKTTCGSKMLDNFIAPYNATVVNNMNQAGVISLGKTNMDEFAMGSSNETSYYGPVKNPWNTQTVPGGSSGGSAAAVAARLVPGATGTDTGGSIRQPAALCGITGLKPTYGLVSRYGMIAFASSLDQAGPMAQTAEDCGLLLQSMAGFDPLDSTSIEKPLPNFNAELMSSLKGKTFGLPKEFFQAGLDSSVSKVIDEAINQFKKLGVNFKEISLPNLAHSVPVYYVVAPAECSSNLSRYDGVRFGHCSTQAKNLDELYKFSRAEGFGSEVKRRIMIGTYALSSGYYDAYYLKAQKLRQKIAQDFALAFKEVDLILSPTAPTTAFKIGAKSTDLLEMYLQDIYTIAVNLAGLAAISLPAGLADNMPVGVQLIGNHFSEPQLLNAGHQFQLHTSHHQKTPIDFA